MKRCLYICILCTLLLGRAGVGYSQDFARIGERSIMGTARYVGMSGAMSAIGGDPTAVHDNVAGLGLYRRMEAMISLDQTLDRTWMVGLSNNPERRYIPMLTQASVVFSAPKYKETEQGVLFNNFLLSYRRLQTFGRTMYGEGRNGSSLGALLPDLDVPFCKDARNGSHYLLLQESGSVNEYAFSWAMNISNKWFIGAGLQIQSYSLNSEAEYKETFSARNAEGINYSNKNATTLMLSGVSSSLSVGLICRPTGWLRLGAGLQTYSLGSLSTYTSGTLTAQTDSLRNSSIEPPGYRDGNISTQPLHLSTSVAFQIGAYGMASLQYDLFHQLKEDPMHSLRVGFEVIPVLGLYINAGYAFESTFQKTDRVFTMDPTFDRQDTYYQYPQMAHYASLAIGYRGTYMMVQAAYQYRLQNIHLYAHEAADPYDMRADTHRLVVTIGWHHP